MKPKVAVVLSGGGAKGAYEAGALASIVKITPEIHIMTGASIGAINAAVFAWEYEKTSDLSRAVQAVQATWLELGGLFRLSPWEIAAKAVHAWLKTGSPINFSALVNNAKIRQKLATLIPIDLKISDLKKIDLVINATSLTTGKTVSFTRKNDAYLYEAVLASSCLPLIFETQKINSSYYVDGGVFNNTPLRDALVAGATNIFVVELKPKTKELYFETIADQRPFSNVHEVGARMIELITDKIMYEDLKNAKKVNQILNVIIALEKSGVNPRIIAELKQSIGYTKNGQLKRQVEFYEIAPSQRLEPPGTLGFENLAAIKEIIRLGEKDARDQLLGLNFHWNRRKISS